MRFAQIACASTILSSNFKAFLLHSTMSCFSIEDDGYFISETRPDYPEDPFKVMEKPLPEKPIRVEQYSDISDDDFQIPCSQKRLPPRLVTLFYN